jgi:pimeloyl-ACP methyl ester carboxylesterase/DNA-binding SARP family transcriptional activator
MAKMAKAGALTLRFLGELEIRRGATAMRLPQSRKTLALLAYLVVSGAPHRRERLCSLFWDVADDPRAALRWSLSKLRPLIDDGDALRLVSQSGSICFEARGATVDFLRVRERLAGGTAPLSITALRDLVPEFRGDFLDGIELPDFFGFQSWCLAQREEARRLHAKVRRALVERLASRPAEALEHAQQLSTLEPYDEEAHAAMVRLLVALGRVPEAERQSALAARLLEELGVPVAGHLREALSHPTGVTAAVVPVSRGVARAPTAGAVSAEGAPETRYARNGDVSIAYQVTGTGPIDLVLVPGWVSHVEYAWEVPSYARFLRRLASFARLILLDRRGTGLSDRVANLPSLEERMEDTRAVMDAAGSRRAALFGISEGGPICLTFAATYPERTAALVLGNTTARMLEAPDYPQGWPREVFEGFLRRLENWGNGHSVDMLAPSVADDPEFRRSWARFERFAVSPAGFQTLMRMTATIDARHTLSVVTAPTLIVHRVGDRILRVEAARYMAERIRGARLVELPGTDHFLWVGDADGVLDEVEEFLTGVRGTREADRQLMTLLFTDIANSTARAARLGDRNWVELIARHDAVVRRQLAAFHGAEINHLGDGFLATFDGPARAIRCATRIVGATRDIGLEVRAGVHTGECERHEGQLRGLALHIGARVAAAAEPGEVLVSQTVRDLIAGSAIMLESRGRHTLKGIPGEWGLYAVRA